MGKKSKTGKQRKDKFYRLAKETGFRSRASFKLMQLNRKFEFLQKSRVLVDLCAAPGGWLQVAQQAMPVSSVIIGVDLVTIRPIPNVITLQEDITTDKCRQALKKQLKTWKADAILHDGAPNVGKNWIHDAFMQNQLTLSALKLATELLVKGGWFLTKVFRSKDYLSLVWALKKLFKRIHVTKPQASRNESAEIFIVCQGYLAPDRIDPKFLDPSHMFQDVKSKEETKANLTQIAKPKRKAEGYDDELSMYNQLKASDFVFTENHLEKLSKCHEIIFDDDDIRDHKLTTEEIKQCCKDIKVLGKGELRLLLNWRKQLRFAIKGIEDKDKNNKGKDSLGQDEEEKELDDAVKEAEELELSKLQEAKKKKKKILKERRKVHERVNLKMIIKDDEPIVQEDRELFKLSQIRNLKQLSKVEDESNLEFGIDDSQAELNDELENSFRSTYVSYSRENKDLVQTERDAPAKDDESNYSSDAELSSEIEFESEDDRDSEDAEATEAILEGKMNPLMVDLVDRPDRVNDTVEKWFDKEEFADDPDDNDLELDLFAEAFAKKEKGEKGSKETSNKDLNKSNQKKETTATKNDDTVTNSTSNSKKLKKIKLDPEGLALGSLIVQSKKMKRDIIENAYNRFSTNDENLPSWFVEDEKKHYQKLMPVTAAQVAEYKARLKEINARPIKKVIEAKARKKRRASRRMEKARKRAEKITDHPDMTDKEKAEQLKSIYKKALPPKDLNVTYLVAKKGAGRRVIRPAGLKGRYKVVDPRMKKDDRKQKTLLKSQKKLPKQNVKKNAKKTGRKR